MHPLTQTIAALRHRLLIRRRLIAVCSIAATLLAAALVLGLADYLVRFADRGLRIMASGALAAVAAWAVYRWWLVPSRRPLEPLSVARRVEHRFPQLRDQLASAVEFLGQSEDEPGAGSAQLRRQVVAQAQTKVETLPLDEVIDRRPLRRAARWLALAALVLAVCLALDARAVGTALVRLVAPLGATEWPRQHHLAFRDPPSRLAVGETFEAELVDSAGRLPDEVRIEYRTTHDGRRKLESDKMTPLGDVVIARRENVRQSFAFRATGGDDATMPWHDVEVVEPPRLESLELIVHPPQHTGLPARAAERHLDVLAGSSIEVRGTASEPLHAARILINGGAITADLGPDKLPDHAAAFHVPPGRWIAEKSGTYRVELADAEGLAGAAGQWNLRVQPDPPPSVAWRRPSDDLYVTPDAVVPIEVAVSDNLAIHRIDLLIEKPSNLPNGLGTSATGPEATAAPAPDQPHEQRIELFRGPDQVVVEPADSAAPRGDSRSAEYALDLAGRQLPPGTQWTLQAEAADYRPGIGRTPAPRRITIITPDELEARLADRQTQIVRQLERALATERSVREDTRRLEIQQRETGALTPGDRNSLQSAELNQRQVDRSLVDPAEGVRALVAALLDELQMNRLSASDTRSSLDELSAALDRLAAGPLPAAQRELTAAHKAAEPTAAGPGAELIAQSLAAAATAQDQVIDQLESLLGEQSLWADYRRFARQLAELRQDQIKLQESSRAEIGVETMPLDVRELSRSQRANLHKASAGQGALARRYERIEQGMDALGRRLAENDDAAAARLADALQLARSLAIATSMHETALDLADNRVGVALERETQIADQLQQVLDVLRNQSERGPQLAQKLRQAEQQLAALREQAAALRAAIAEAEQQGSAADAGRLKQLADRQAELRRQTEQLARQLDRLQADDASRSTQSAADRLDRRRTNSGQNQAAGEERPSPSNQVQEAEEGLAEAARQLAERRQQEELDIALELVRRFQGELQEMVGRQQAVLRETVQLDRQRQTSAVPTPAHTQKFAKLAAAERALAALAVEHSEALYGLGAVTLSLEEAARRLEAAAAILDRQDAGESAQQAEQRALAQLEGMLEAFKQTAAEAAAPPPPGGAGQGGQNAPTRRPTFELLEVKMLRMLQADLNERTGLYEDQAAAAGARPDPGRDAALKREARALADQQRRLAGLVREMLSRNNKEREP